MVIDFSAKWDQISKPFNSAASIRVAVEHPLNLFVGYSDDGRRELILKSASPVFQDAELPEFENIEIQREDEPGGYGLCIRLSDSSLKDLFSAISADLVDASSKAESEKGAVLIFMSRVLRWSALLEERKRSGLSFSQQLGLLGELYLLGWVLERNLVSAETLVRGWRGPDGDARDINLGATSVEVKATLGTAKNVLTISSLDQLDAGTRQLVITHCRFSPSDNGESLGSLISEIETVLGRFTNARSIFWRKLHLVGFDPDAEYVDNSYELLKKTLYEVSENFPRLTADNVDPAIRKAQYEIDCAGLDGYIIDEEKLEMMVHGRN
ncbi:MAG: hypothetical protein ACJAW7_002600 [Candidatus Azotimanducaceae bacterium]|jgi:hypothetical protein